MNEIVYNFGQENVLCGTLTSPEHKNNSDSLPCFILLNAGLVNQAGPFRLHAELSRELAKHNFHTLRFDLSGIGDSLKHRDSRPHDEQIAGDIASFPTRDQIKTAIDNAWTDTTQRAIIKKMAMALYTLLKNSVD